MLQHSYLNVQGYAHLENLWVLWYGMTPHDAEAVLRLTRIERAMAENLRSPEWEPHAQTLQPGVFASRFPTEVSTLWTMVNRNEYDITGEQLRVSHRAGMHYYDLWHGIELKPAVHGSEATISFNIEGLGFGAILAAESPLSDAPKNLLAYMAERSKRPLSSYSRDWKFQPQAIVEIPPTKLAQTPPPAMVRIPEGESGFQVRSSEMQGGNDPGVDGQYP